jgi:hypothetical protein
VTRAAVPDSAGMVDNGGCSMSEGVVTSEGFNADGLSSSPVNLDRGTNNRGAGGLDRGGLGPICGYAGSLDGSNDEVGCRGRCSSPIQRGHLWHTVLWQRRRASAAEGHTST